MGRVDARRVVTVMEHEEAVQDRPIVQLPGNTVRKQHVVSLPDAAVGESGSHTHPLPLPAFVICAPENIGPESDLKRPTLKIRSGALRDGLRAKFAPDCRRRKLGDVLGTAGRFGFAFERGRQFGAVLSARTSVLLAGNRSGDLGAMFRRHGFTLLGHPSFYLGGLTP
jgi:hypothetical protein